MNQDIKELVATVNTTKRAVAPALEEILYQPIPVLDHGFIRVVDYMGDDSSIVQAARVSYGRGTKKSLQDKGLINYLMRHKHTTPFEMCEIKLHIKLPIFIARQWIRHRTASVNEYSARYSILANEFYLPEPQNIAKQSTSNKQGREEDEISPQDAAKIIDILRNDAISCYKHYEEMIDENNFGLARELARTNLTLNHYTEWYWKINLHNLIHFLNLRADSHAQYEIRVYAQEILKLVKLWVPYAYEAAMDHVIGGCNLSNKALQVIKSMLKGNEVTEEKSGMSPREWRELMSKLDK